MTTSAIGSGEAASRSAAAERHSFHPETCVNIPFSPKRTADRAGLTLFEVLLVLAILVILGAFTWPVLQNVILTEKLRSAAYQIRTAWTCARIEAMNSGRIQRFTYDSLSGAYRVESSVWESNTEDISGSEMMRPQDFGNLPSPDSTGEGTPRVREEILPEGVRFIVLDTASSSRDAAAEEISGGFGTTQELRSTPLFFYPDGTTSAARLILGNEQGRGITVSLRGLTGVVAVGEITALQNEVLP